MEHIADILPCYTVHFSRNNIQVQPTPTRDVKLYLPEEIECTTSCGKTLGGMLFKEITTEPSEVTCLDCQNSGTFPLDVLARVL